MVKQIVIGFTKINLVNFLSYSGRVDHRHNDVDPCNNNTLAATGAHATLELDLRGPLKRDKDEGSGGEGGPSPSAAASKYEMICPTQPRVLPRKSFTVEYRQVRAKKESTG